MSTGLARLRYHLIRTLWPLGKALNWLGNLPLAGRLVAPLFNARDNEATIIPVQQAITGTKSVALPYPLLVPLVERASARFILDECPCRHGERCQTYPHDVGCLYLGDGAAQIRAELGRQASIPEVLAHLDRAMDAGLTPTVVHAAFDAYMLDIPYRRMLAVCFCCDCCCTVRYGLRVGPAAFRDIVLRLPGLALVVDDTCTACGVCAAACPVQAITLNAGSRDAGQGSAPIAPAEWAQVDAERCKGCGRCVAACPSGAIHLHLADEADMVARLLARVALRTDILS